MHGPVNIGIRDLHITVLIICEYRANRRREGSTFLTGIICAWRAQGIVKAKNNAIYVRGGLLDAL